MLVPWVCTMWRGSCDRHWHGAGTHRQCWSSGWGGCVSLPSLMPRVGKEVVNVDGTAGKGVSDGVCMVGEGVSEGVCMTGGGPYCHVVDIVADG